MDAAASHATLSNMKSLYEAVKKADKILNYYLAPQPRQIVRGGPCDHPVLFLPLQHEKRPVLAYRPFGLVASPRGFEPLSTA